MKTAVILAAGIGSRLGTLPHPKPMTEVNNTPIIDNLVKSLIDNKFDTIVIVVGYKAEILINDLSKYKDQTNIIFVNNKIYDKTNNIYSLWLAKEYLINGFYLFEADIYFDSVLITKLVNNTSDNIMVVDRFDKKLMNGTVVTIKDNYADKMYLGKEQPDDFDYSNTFKTVNFYKLSKEYVNNSLIVCMDKHIKNDDLNIYYEQIFKEDIQNGVKFLPMLTDRARWWEIDTPYDLKIAEEIFMTAAPI